jgi:hypothetical protein
MIMVDNKSRKTLLQEDYYQLFQDLETVSDNAKVHHHSKKEGSHLGLKKKERQTKLSSKKQSLPPSLPSSPNLDDCNRTMQAIRRQNG